MTYTIERTDKEILIKLPIDSTSDYVQRMLDLPPEARKRIEDEREAWRTYEAL